MSFPRSTFHETMDERRARWEREDLEQRAEDAERSASRRQLECRREANAAAEAIDERDSAIVALSEANERCHTTIAELSKENARLRAEVARLGGAP